ncbi:MAG: amino acid ABC transporter substrate-binding protein [Egibacteraceae bacterium]
MVRNKLVMLVLALTLAATACTAEEGGGGNEGEGAVEGAQDATATEEGAGEAGGAAGQASGILQAVQDRGTLRCGVNDAVPGFGFTDAEGNFSGFDIDFCKVIAAAVLGDAEAVEFRPLTAEQRFTALQSGEIDVLVRNTTWTSSRDGSEGATFLTTTFYDGQGMMVRADSEFETLEDMQNTDICVLSGTTTELNLSSRFAAGDIQYSPVPFEDNETLQQAFEQGRCDGWTSDKSQLAGVRSNLAEGPETLRILDETFSKEPLGPLVRDGDQPWAQAVDWAIIATIQAEEFEITSENVNEMTDSDNPEVLRFLGQPVAEEEGADPAVFDPGLGLPTDFAVQIIEQVGNYAEIYDRNVGPDTALGLERGVNALYTDGGLHYPPPYR